MLRSLGGRDLHQPIVAIHKHRSSAIDAAMPDTFTLDGRVQRKRRLRRRRISKIDAVAVGIAGKSQFQADRFLPRSAFNRVLALANASRDLLGPAHSVDGNPPSRASEATTVFKPRRPADEGRDTGSTCQCRWLLSPGSAAQEAAQDSAEIDIPRPRASGSSSEGYKTKGNPARGTDNLIDRLSILIIYSIYLEVL